MPVSRGAGRPAGRAAKRKTLTRKMNNPPTGGQLFIQIQIHNVFMMTVMNDDSYEKKVIYLKEKLWMLDDTLIVEVR